MAKAINQAKVDKVSLSVDNIIHYYDIERLEDVNVEEFDDVSNISRVFLIALVIMITLSASILIIGSNPLTVIENIAKNQLL